MKIDSFCRATFFLGVLALGATGCSTWRCRGFVNEREMPSVKARTAYVLDSIEFRKMASMDEEALDRVAKLAWLSKQDGLVDTSYLADIGKEVGLSNAVPDAVKIHVSIVPISGQQDGRWSILWPMCCSFGVFPAHLIDQIPFDIIVQFDTTDEDGKDYHFASASVGLVRIDYQFGLSRLDMDAPPDAPSAVGEVRDDGTIGTGRGIRPKRFRDIFVRTVAAAVRKAIAKRESAECHEAPQPATEFGPVPFPSPDVQERETTSGWGKGPIPVSAPPETQEEFLNRAWSRPWTSQLKNLRRMVDMGMITKDDWRKQVTDIWKKGNRVK